MESVVAFVGCYGGYDDNNDSYNNNNNNLNKNSNYQKAMNE